MQRACRVRRYIFDIHRSALPAVIAAIIITGSDDGGQFSRPQCRFDPHIDKTGTGNFNIGDAINGLQSRGKLRREIARLCANLLGQNHRRVTGQIAMRRVARQFKHNPPCIHICRQNLFHLHRFNNRFKFSFKQIENIHIHLKIGPSSKRRSCSRIA